METQPGTASSKPTKGSRLPQTSYQKLVGQQGRDWQHKFKGQRHLGVSILVKVQQIMSKLALAAGDLDVEEWNFKDGPMPHDSSSDLQEAFDLMDYFLHDLH